MSIRNVASVAVFALLSLSGCLLAADPTPKTGDQAKPFALKDLQGEQVALETATKDGPAVLIVLRGWPGYQRPLCTRQVGEFLGKAKQFQEAGATVVLVYPGPAADLDEHAKEFAQGKTFPANFRFVLDPDHAMVAEYGLRWNAPNETAYPSTFVIDQDGKIVFAKVSADHGGRASAEEILKALPKK
jgi:peroxiredoxin